MRPSKPLVWTAILMLLPQLSGCWSWQPITKPLPHTLSEADYQDSPWHKTRVEIKDGLIWSPSAIWADSATVFGRDPYSGRTIQIPLSDVQTVKIRKFSVSRTLLLVSASLYVVIGAATCKDCLNMHIPY